MYFGVVWMVVGGGGLYQYQTLKQYKKKKILKH